MKKYVVNVKFSNGNNAIILAKAKNDFDLEDKMAKELNEIFDDMNFINGIEFEEINRKTFNKKESKGEI